MIQIKSRFKRAFVALVLSFLPTFLIADLAHAEEESLQVSVTISLDEQITQAEIAVADASSQIEIITQDLEATTTMVEQLVNGGSSSLASVSEVIALASAAVSEASAALLTASDALWDAKEKQDSYKAAVAANQLANANLVAAQSNHSQAVVNLSAIAAAVTLQQQIVQQEQSKLNALQNQPSNSYETSSPGWTDSVEPSPNAGTTVTLPPMGDASTKINVPFDIKMGNTLYEGQGSASQIFVTSKAFISFGQPDHTFWDWPQTTGIYVYQSDWMTNGSGAYTKITTTENTLKVEWSLKRFGDSNGPLTNVIWSMTVDPATGEWTGYSEISGNTSNLYGGPRIGVRYSNGGPIQTMSPKVLDSVTADLIAQQQQVVTSESLELVDLQTQKTLQTAVVHDKVQVLSVATSDAALANNAELLALGEFTQALQGTQGMADNLIILIENAKTQTQTAYIVITDAIASLPTPAPPVIDLPVVVEPTPTEEPKPEPTQPVPTPSPSEETPVVPSPEPSPTIEPTPLPEPKPEPQPEPKPSIPEELTPETPITKEIVEDLLSENFEPTTLTEEQIEQVKELANEIFATAEPGSAAYEQALDLLMVAAQADDVQLSEELAAIPLIGDVAGAVLQVFNDLGNVGADMSPQVREKSEDVIVAAVIVGQVAITATTAAASAAAVSARRI